MCCWRVIPLMLREIITLFTAGFADKGVGMMVIFPNGNQMGKNSPKPLRITARE